MTQVGEAAFVAQNSAEGAEDLYRLRYKLVDESAKGVEGVPYKTVKSGSSAEPLHVYDSATLSSGETKVVSRTKDEKIDFYISWAKLKVNKDFLKF